MKERNKKEINEINKKRKNTGRGTKKLLKVTLIIIKEIKL